VGVRRPFFAFVFFAVIPATIANGQDVFVWGTNPEGQTNVPISVMNAIQCSSGAFAALALKADGTVTSWGRSFGDFISSYTVPASATNVVAVSAGGDHSLALRADGRVVAWGRNWQGQTNVPSSATNIVAISGGGSHCLAVRADGTVLAWGNNDCGQTNVPAAATNVIEVAGGYYHSAALRSDGTVVTWGWDVPVLPDATNIVAIAAGWEHCLALKADGSVVGWGDDSYGQPTVPDSASNIVAISAGYYHDLALRADGTTVAWGTDFYGVNDFPQAIVPPVSGLSAGEDYSLVWSGAGAPLFIRQPTCYRSDAGSQVVLSPELAGDRPMGFQWYFKGAQLGGETNQWLVLGNVQPDQGGQYQLVATNNSGSVTSSIVPLTISVPSSVIANPAFAGTSFSFGFYAVKSVEYAAEYKNSVDDPSWQLLQSTTGAGSYLTVTDPGPIQSARFYRVRITQQ
jgi:hypothetical protein